MHRVACAHSQDIYHHSAWAHNLSTDQDQVKKDAMPDMSDFYEKFSGKGKAKPKSSSAPKSGRGR